MTSLSELDQLEQQLFDLQTRLAFQEDSLQALNDIVTRQQQQIENLHELSKSQRSQLELMTDTMGGTQVDEKPPHYWATVDENVELYSQSVKHKNNLL